MVGQTFVSWSLKLGTFQGTIPIVHTFCPYVRFYGLGQLLCISTSRNDLEFQGCRIMSFTNGTPLTMTCNLQRAICNVHENTNHIIYHGFAKQIILFSDCCNHLLCTISAKLHINIFVYSSIVISCEHHRIVVENNVTYITTSQKSFIIKNAFWSCIYNKHMTTLLHVTETP